MATATNHRVKELLKALDNGNWVNEQVKQIRAALDEYDVAAALEQIDGFESDADLLKRQIRSLRDAVVNTCKQSLGQLGYEVKG